MSVWQDIPQDVWVAAERQVSAELSGHSRAHKTKHGLKLIVARAILAAKAEERSDERVTEILHAVLDCPHEIEASEIRLHRANGKEGNATFQLHGRIAAAIRKRGEG